MPNSFKEPTESRIPMTSSSVSYGFPTGERISSPGRRFPERAIELLYTGNGFLYNMVRILTGTLLEIGSGMRKPEEMKVILEAKNRDMAGRTAPPEGLFLLHVAYEGERKTV